MVARNILLQAASSPALLDDGYMQCTRPHCAQHASSGIAALCVCVQVISCPRKPTQRLRATARAACVDGLEEKICGPIIGSFSPSTTKKRGTGGLRS
jgi:hypothetical protein